MPTTQNFVTTNKLSLMYSVAASAHKYQLDKNGRPYFEHVLAVMLKLPDTADNDLKCIALGHDLIEDTGITYKYLIEVFGFRIADGIYSLTKHEWQTYEQYLEQVRSNKDARIVKLCDLRHNTDITRLPGTSEKDLARLAKYAKAYEYLSC